jgi:hypothetical protein
MKKVLILFAAATLVFGSMLFGQEQTGEVIGTVVLEDGSAIPGVAVEATGTKLVGVRTTVTSETGAFRFMGLPPGTYEFTFVLEGFKTKKQKDVKVEVGRTYKLDVVMETGAIREEVVVTGKSPVIDVRKSGSATNISKETFSKLPKGRNFMTIVTQTAGLNFESEFQTAAEASDEDYGAGVSFDGASASENTFYVDGVDTTTLYEGKAGTDVNFDFIEEVQVKSSGYAAEYGGSMGGVISVITRSGGNEFHGSLSAYFDGSILGDDPRPSLRINALDNTIAEYVTYPEDSWTRIEPGIGLGGYIIKDKLWFFGSYMPKFRKATRNGDDWPVPGGTIFLGDTHISGSNEFTRKDTTQAASLKLTGQLANNLRLSVSGTLDYSDWLGELPGVNGTGNPEKDFSIYGFKQPRYTMGGSLDYTLGNNLMLNASMGYYWADYQQRVLPDMNRMFFYSSNAGIPGVTEVHGLYWANMGWADGFATAKQIENKLTGTFDATYYANLAGEHVFKGGIQMVRIGVDRDNACPNDYNYFYWGWDYEHSDGTTRPTTLGYVGVRDPFGVVATVNSTRWALYLQDSWTIGDKFTLNLGIRVEKEDIPAYAEGYEPPVTFDFFDKFAPRVGFAYDVFGDSSLKIFGSFGIYYDVMKLEMAEGSYGGFKWWSHYYDIVDPQWQVAYATNQEHPIESGYAGGTYFESRDWRVPSYETTQPNEGEYKMKPYQKNEYTLGLQKTLGEDWSVSVRALHNYIVNAIEDIGITIHGHENYYNGNPGSAWIQMIYEQSMAEGYIPYGVQATKAVREYTSVTLALDRKFKDNWLGGLSLTWSRLYGNFAGLASSDEHGRKSPSVERYFDSWFMFYDQNGSPVLGLLPTDRPIQFKAYGAYSFDFGLTLGFSAYAMTGTPLQTEFCVNRQDGYYPLGRFSDGRTDFLWQIDAYAEYNLKLSDKYSLNFNVNVSNITNNKIAQRVFMNYTQQDPSMSNDEIISGFDFRQVAIDKGLMLDPRYKMEYRYLNAIAARIGVKLLF